MSKTWIVYKAEQMDAPGWEDRMLMPNESLTNILHEEWDAAGHAPIPALGDRPRIYANLQDPGNGVTHGRDGDWVVTRVQTFANSETSEQVIICHCAYSPIPEQWEALHRGAPVNEILATRV